MSDPVEIVEYSADWPQAFVQVRARLSEFLPMPGFVIEHIGSTAVPGLAAKPVIDVMVGGASLAEIEARIPALVAAGFRYVPAFENVMPQRRYFTFPAQPPHQVHVHAVKLGDDFWNDHLLFRDALRRDAALVQAYQAVKRRLAEHHAHDRAAYTDGKAPFIRRVMADLHASRRPEN